MVDDVLVQRCARGDHDADRTSATAARAPYALPGRGNGPRISRQNRHVQTANVDPQFQGIRRHHATDRSLPKTTLDLPSLSRQVAATIPHNDVFFSDSRGDVLLEKTNQHLCDQPAVRENDGASHSPEETCCNAAGFLDIRPSDPKVPVDDRRIVKEQMLFTLWSAAVLDQLEFFPRQPFGQFSGVGDRCRRTDKPRLAAVKPADSLQAPEQVGQMAPEDTSVRMQFVDDHILEVLEDTGPLGVMGQDALVEHVGVR